MKYLIIGGAGFIGSHAADYYSSKNHDVIIIDNFSRSRLLKKEGYYGEQNWPKLKSKYPHIKLFREDVRNTKKIDSIFKNIQPDVIINAAGQTAIAPSIEDPREDMENNFLTTFNVLEASRKYCQNPTILYCSTNKVYGDNPNKIQIIEDKLRYKFQDPDFIGFNEEYSIDNSIHTPYGASKLAADIYTQEYSKTYGIKTGIFRMSCIYGPNQMSFEDQAWVTFLIKKAIKDGSVNIFGNGKQVRDILYIDDLIRLYDNFITNPDCGSQIFCVGGGMKNSISILELLNLIEDKFGQTIKKNYFTWRKGDQKIYISDISKAKNILGWEPSVSVFDGIGKLIDELK